MSKMNINKGWKYKWNVDEDNIIRKYYPINGYSKVLELLPHRNKKGVQERASKLNVSYLTYNENYFEMIDTKQKAYWLGFMYADGYVTTTNRWGIELSIIDKNHLEQFTNDFGCNINIKTRKRIRNNKTNYSCYFQIKNKKMFEDLEKCGVIRNKTEIMKFPNKTILSKEFYPDFIRGLFDGDGSYIFYRYEQRRKDRNDKIYNRLVKQISFVCKSSDFINKLQKVIYEECGVDFHLYYNKRDNLPTLYISKKEKLCIFLKYIYNDIENIRYLERKYFKSLEILKYCLA